MGGTATPAYDFACDACQTVTEATRPMSEAGLPFECPQCGQPTRRMYDLNVSVVMRPQGYSLKPGDSRYWDGFSDPFPKPQAWQRGRGRQARNSWEYE